MAEKVPESRFFDVQFRNSQLKSVIRRIGGLRLIKSRTLNAVKPFIYNDDRTQYNTHVDTKTENIIGADTFIDALNADNTTGNYIIHLAPVIIKSQPSSTAFSLFIMDLDVGHAEGVSGIETFKTKYKDKYGFKRTLTVSTKSGGRHLYYYIRTEDIRKIGFNKKVDFDAGIDLLSSMATEGLHTIIGPGSQQFDKEAEKRRQYEIIVNEDIQSIPDSFVQFLVDTYAKLNLGLDDAKVAVDLASKRNIREDEPQNLQLAENYVNKIIVEAHEKKQLDGKDPFANTRNDNFNIYAYRISSFGLSLKTIKRLLVRINTQAFLSPLDDYAFNRTAESAYNARIIKNESFINAIHNIPKFPPYSARGISGERIVGYKEIIERLNARPNEPIKTLVQSTDGVQYYADCVFVASGTFVELSKRPTNTIFVEAEELLTSKDRLSFGHIRTLLNRIELQFNVFSNETRFNLHVGPAKLQLPPKDGKKKRGRFSDNITKHPVFIARTISGLNKDFSRPRNNNIIEGDVFHQVSPPPIADFAPLSKEEMDKGMPIVNGIFEHFKNTLTNPNHPEETIFLINRIAAMVQRKENVQNFIVLYGSGGTGKSTLLQLLSLFIASSDRLNASIFEDITRRFSIPGELTTIDDCDLSKAKEWDALKSLASLNEITVEEKGGKVYRIVKKVNLFMCTNKKIPQIEKLSDRRMYLLKGLPKYTSEEYQVILDIMTRKLLENNLLGLRALYQYLLKYTITIEDWNQSSAAQQEMITEMSSMSSVLGALSPTVASERLQKQQIDERIKFRRPILNMIANFGFLSSKIDSKVRIPLVATGINLTQYHAACSYDVGYFVYYFNNLKPDSIYTEEQYYNTLKVDIRQKLSRLTSNMLNHGTPFAEVIGEINADITKKITTRLPKFKSQIGQKRQFILSPINYWLKRLCFLVGDSMSDSISKSFIAHYGLADIVQYIEECNAKKYEPERAECEAILKASFPNAILGEFDLLAELGNVDGIDDFLTEDDAPNDNW